ncbi:hypothetical protein KDU71_01770 [Carboxylicivirga sediminis]|uniref:Uncharacterized protein n=1 Tax=Carboxylicivirga sediminis TaxID=2006564 RepID=A0A941IWA9_9BACT|nr:hypothetical protein [Carboxylicivirga sediminis]MBR8534269.1 hypothetical protein [Carboxylicivirga sediminis]
MEAIIGIALLVGAILLLRAIGAWMLRIDEVIKHQKEIVTELKKISGKGQNTNA